MRIPTSVLVMSVVTAVPFGLGIRDQLTKKEVSADEFDDGIDFGGGRSARERERELAEYEAELRREEAEREKAAQERLERLDQVYGERAATMGTLLEGISLGAGAGAFQPENVRRRIEHATKDNFFSVMFDADTRSLNAVIVTVSDDYDYGNACDKFPERLARAWGSSPTMVWQDVATHQRASYDTDSCQLRFERYIEPAEWVAQLPLNGIGMSLDKFIDQLPPGSVSDSDETGVYWVMPGIGFGKGDTRLEAYTVKNKIVGLKATVATDFNATLAVREALSAKLKAQPKKTTDEEVEYDGYNVWEWKRRVPVTLDQFDTDRFSVLVGKMPWD
jgi:hypothetical protein